MDKNAKNIIQGAYEINNLIYDIYILEWDIFKMFIDLRKWYPIKKFDSMFDNPFSWTIKNDMLGSKCLVSNCVQGFGGYYLKIGRSYFFISFNINFEEDNINISKRNEDYNLIKELIIRNIIELKDVFKDSKILKNKNLNLIYLPKEYARKLKNTDFLQSKNKYINSDIDILKDKILMRFTLNEDIVWNDILNAQNRIVECEVMKELLQPLNIYSPDGYQEIAKFLDNTKLLKKNIKAVCLDLNYVFSNKNLGFWPSEEIFAKVRKIIAIECKKKKFKTKVYKSTEAGKIIREIQQLIIPIFEKEISEFDQTELHKHLISDISFYIHKKTIELKRYTVKNSTDLTEKAKENVAESVVLNREKCKDKIRDLYYLIDTNLSIDRDKNSIKKIKKDNLEYLLAFSNILINLQDCADKAFYNLFDIKLKIEEDFVIDIIYPKNYLQSVETRNLRIYDNKDYTPTLSNEEELIKKCFEAFYKDTSVHLECIISICNYLAKEFSSTFNEQEYPDVYSIKLQDLIYDFESILINKSETSKKDHIKALEYLIIDKTKIKQINGENNPFVPIWERERRNNRFEVKPIIKDGDNIIFSPIVMYELSQLWINGTLGFFPPYEIGLSNYRKQLDDWKSLCEKQMETELHDLFVKYGYKTFKNVQLHKRDKEYKHPKDLGDYDILAIDLKQKIIWNIESKFLGMVGSIKEYYNHQDSFFNKNKKDEKYSKRIDYLTSNKNRILEILAGVNGDDYIIKNYMVTNKVFIPDVKNVNFQIITISELRKILEENKRN